MNYFFDFFPEKDRVFNLKLDQHGFFGFPVNLLEYEVFKVEEKTTETGLRTKL